MLLDQLHRQRDRVNPGGSREMHNYSFGRPKIADSLSSGKLLHCCCVRSPHEGQSLPQPALSLDVISLRLEKLQGIQDDRSS